MKTCFVQEGKDTGKAQLPGLQKRGEKGGGLGGGGWGGGGVGE